MLLDRYFSDRPARNSLERIGRTAGDMVGICVFAALTWSVLHAVA